MKFIWRKKIIFLILTLSFSFGLVWFFTQPVSAQALNTGINFVANTGLSNQDPRVTIANIIRIALGFLGIIAIGLIIYAGFIWMTAKGDEEKVGQARKIMTSAVIGLVIVLAAFGIATFILSRLLGATGSSNNNGGNGGGGGGFGNGSDVFMVDATTPPNQGINVIRNAVIRFHFTKAVSNSSVNANTFSVQANGSTLAGQRVVNGNYIEFTPEAFCEAPNDTIKCLPKNTTINVSAQAGAIISLDNKQLICSGNSLCNIQFTTGEIVDTKAPSVNLTSQQICAAADNTLSASSIDDYGVAKIDFYVADNLIGSGVNNSNPFVGSPFNTSVNWNANNYQVGQNIKLKATAYDLDSNSTSAEKTVRLSAAHCCNGIKDGDETGVDCGGGCLACSAQACAIDRGTPSQCSNELCSSGYCSAQDSSATTCEAAGYPKGTTNCCLCQGRPTINWLSPAGGFCSNDVNKFCHKDSEKTDCGAGGVCDLASPNGSVGNFITIAGSGFGTARGKVYFSGSNNTRVEAKLADDASAGNPACSGDVWKDNQIIAIVPANAVAGEISIETKNGVIDATNDAYGPLINDFKINTIDRPGVCSVSPGSGKSNDTLEYQGVKLSSGEAYYGNLTSNVKAAASSFTSARQGTATVPSINSGDTTTFVKKADVESNFLPFTKEGDPYNGPIIASLDPTSGPVGQYVTIHGSGFGDVKSSSKIIFANNSKQFEADYSFPQICATSVWTDKQIVVKVPAGIDLGDYKIVLQRTGYNDVDSGDKTFRVVAGSPNPGLCLIQPILGQANSEVTLWGEYFRGQDNNSAVRFYNNHSQQGSTITFWNIDQEASGIKPWKVITTVPQNSATGPVNILVGSPVQISNSLNFQVGQCTKDSDCGSTQGATCCAAGLPEAGKCKASALECYGTIATSVYEWRFSTGSTTSCAADQQKCGNVCCAIGQCADPAQSKCTHCLSGQNECGNGECCNLKCEGNPSSCPDPTSCSGYSYNQCLEGYYCPNSPGLCSPYPGGGNINLGQCGDAFCNTQPGCENNACRYDTNLNLCVKNDALLCRKDNLKDSNGNVIKLNNQPVVGTCDVYNNDNHWYLTKWTASCPAGWVKLSGNRCVDPNINGDCAKCDSSFTCQGSATSGQCAINKPICPAGATCNSQTNQCVKTSNGSCDCCCRKDHAQQDCCSGLTCEGSCGSGQSNLGLCSGCVVNGEPNDSLCNCVGTTGKFCDPSTPRGVCKDCSSITDPTECSRHAECCVDGKNNNRCTSVAQGGNRLEKDNLQYCAYYNCNNTNPNSCNEQAVVNGTYNKLSNCQQACATAPIYCSQEDNCANPQCPGKMRCDLATCTCKGSEPTVGEPCRDPLTNACTGQCSAGYQCLLPGVYNNGNQNNANSGASGNGTCLCCCKPKTSPEQIDTCKQINESLSCIPDKEPCSSPAKERGLCCGCSKDSQCGDVSTTGCSTTDTCCRTRPTITEHTPKVDENNVCRNTAVQAIFDQRMDTASFSDNVRLIADYGSSACPSGYAVVAEAARPNSTIASLIFGAKKIITKVFPALLSKPAFADVSNYCYVPGSPVGYDINPQQSAVSYNLTKPLDPNRHYYMVLMGDPDLIDGGAAKDYYNSKINNLDKVGMIGHLLGKVPNDGFNSTLFNNSEVWSFTTGNDICKLDKVLINPNFRLFQTIGQVEGLRSSALDNKGREIQSISSFYAWTWDWSSDDASIVKVEEVSENVGKATASDKQDAQTLGRAKATITVDTFSQPSSVGQSRQGSSRLRLFLCQNPWPVYYAYPPFPPGYVWPWQDDKTGIEFYYCRDKNGQGTVDDLPALNDSPVTKENNRKICMFGSNVGRVCTADAGCGNVAGSCLPEVLKEFFFFRQTEPGIPSLGGQADALGKKVNLSWSATANAARYKIYYGLNSGQYVYTVDVPAGGATITKSIDNLVNGLNYYFVVTAISSKNQESVYSNEVKIKPADTTAPAVPTLRASAGDGKIALYWEKVSDAVSYIAYLGTQPHKQAEYAVSSIVRITPPANTPNIVFTSINGGPLNNNTTYYVSVVAIDQYGNKSDYAEEIAKKPNEPYLSSASFINSSSVSLEWLPFINATGYKLYYGLKPEPTEDYVTVSANTLKKTIDNLKNETYYFRITALKAGGESGYSNQRQVSNTINP